MLTTASILWIAGALAVVTAPINDLTDATTAFLAGLNDAQRATASYPFDADERWNWHFIPKARPGLAFTDLEESQYPLAMNVLKAGLSEKGVKTVEGIRDLENVLREMEGPQATHRNPLDYHFTVFGTPAKDGAWALRFEGHHLSLHWTIVDGKAISTTPQFFGSNPGEVMTGSRAGARVLGDLEDLGRAFATSLSGEQRAAAIISADAPDDVMSGVGREISMQEDKGLAYAALTEAQQQAFIGLIEAYAQYQRPEIAAQRLARIQKAGLDGVKFAWMGSLEKGQRHYYRIQGKTFILEYDNTQNNANHPHSVWRDAHGDFGEDLLKEHYAREHQH